MNDVNTTLSLASVTKIEWCVSFAGLIVFACYVMIHSA